MIELNAVSKTYRENGIRALCGVDFSLKAGEIHAVLGENGAGKSTLMHILSGFIRPDAGRMVLNGKERRFASPSAALRAGIGMVRQRPALLESWSVWENCACIGRGGLFFNRARARAACALVADKLGFQLPLDAKAGALTAAGQKKTAVVALVVHGAAFFVFDEPFAGLSLDERQDMARLLVSLKRQGKGVAVIAHEIEEIFQIAGRFTVLRKGRVALAGDKESLDEAGVVKAMFGKELSGHPRRGAARSRPSGGEAALSVNDVCVNRPPFYPLEHISFQARRGEITGIAGIKEDGVQTLVLTLAGFIEPSGGFVTYRTRQGAARLNNTGGDFAYMGPGFFGDVKPFAPELSIRDNLALYAHRNYVDRRGVLDAKGLSAFAASLVDRAGVAASVAAPASSLSGGMLARVIAERELAKGAEILLLSEPSAGLDLRAEDALFLKIRDFRDSGGAVLLFSGGREAEWMCDTIVFIEHGRMAGVKRCQ